MSLFDLQDVRIAIRSIATLDLPIVVDLIGIYGFKGPYRTLTTNNWFLQALSVIPRGSWGDVARRSYHDPLGRFPHGYSAQCVEHTKRILGVRLPKKSTEVKSGFADVEGQNAVVRRRIRAPPPPPPPPLFAGKSFPANLDEENPSAPISSGLLVQADEGIPSPVVNLIDDIYRRLP
ncbi:polygalacturonase inhibitor 1-like [Dorcoceras hygrometricum]|uniref:Polygalacturonase inhibitor 1-like n=1 Tax=Dorcoceras hygrometricum TaxID=472368 RepID=A0A2Z7BVT2_9LAMI|nr:polygalacturonase inhibitor 1-like [Dorcoceras hygrometricum]